MGGSRSGSQRCDGVLIVEDNSNIRESLKEALELAGYRAFSAENGKEGLKLLSSKIKPCLILLDLAMPVMNGWEFAKALKADKDLSKIPIVIVSTVAEQATSIEAEAKLGKPVDLEHLFELVKRYCA